MTSKFRDPDAISAEKLAQMGLSRDQFRDVVAAMTAREEKAPAIGSPAPDFEIERLSPQGKRTGTFFRLSSNRGRPVGLVFGSYT